MKSKKWARRRMKATHRIWAARGFVAINSLTEEEIKSYFTGELGIIEGARYYATVS